jgi:hypothetical protein
MKKIKDQNLINFKKKKNNINEILVIEGLKYSNCIINIIDCLELK